MLTDKSNTESKIISPPFFDEMLCLLSVSKRWRYAFSCDNLTDSDTLYYQILMCYTVEHEAQRDGWLW